MNRDLIEPHECDRCGETYDEAGGDGYMGLCPSCADRQYLLGEGEFAP